MQTEEIAFRNGTSLRKKMERGECCQAVVMHLLIPRSLVLYSLRRCRDEGTEGNGNIARVGGSVMKK